MKKITIDDDWKFFPGDLPPFSETDNWGGAKAHAYNFGAVSSDFDDRNWRTVNLPHDFVLEGSYTLESGRQDVSMTHIPEMESIDSRHFAGGCLAGGVGWYRKRLIIPKEAENKRLYLCFGGIYRNSTVYLNEYYVGSHKSGYTEIRYDITDFIRFGEENILAVRVDARGREGWWYEGGGIYRHVRLEYAEPVHAKPNGIYIRSDCDLEHGRADIHIQAEFLNKNFDGCDASVQIQILDNKQSVLAECGRPLHIDAWDFAKTEFDIPLEHAVFWDLDNPVLYQLKVTVISDGASDTTVTAFGIRKIGFDAEKGFFLNEKPIKIKGLCCHHDHAGVGIAAPDSIVEYRLAQMKSMGANAYRSAHYPASEELLNACDRLGILVFDETRRMSSAPDDIEALKNMVAQGRNHACIFLWGIGNEEVFAQKQPEAARVTRTMKAELQKLDTSRPITSAVVCWDGKQRFNNAEGYIHVTRYLDIMGFNYCRTAWDDYHNRMPNQPLIITEVSTNSWTRSCYSTQEDKGWYYILDPGNADKCKNSAKSVKRDIAETEWKMIAERDYISGVFLWTGMDYRGEPTPLTYPAISSQFGIFDYCGFPKDNYYYYKSWWNSEPVLHIFPHWNHPVPAGERLNVYCYSNMDEVELFVNGKSYGRKAMQENWYLEWEDVVYEPGVVTARGYKNGDTAAETQLTTTDAPCRIVLSPYQTVISTKDTAIINVSVIDKNGAVVPTADNEISFTVSGAGTFLGCGNGNPGSHESDLLPLRRAFNGLCQILMRPDMPGEITVSASASQLEGAAITVTVE